MRNFFRFIAKHNFQGKALEADYLVEACNYTEAEARAKKHIQSFSPGDVVITNIMPVDYVIGKIVKTPQVAYYEVLIEFLTLDERSGFEKRVRQKTLVTADNEIDALATFVDCMRVTLPDYQVIDVKKTPFLDVFFYF